MAVLKKKALEVEKREWKVEAFRIKREANLLFKIHPEEMLSFYDFQNRLFDAIATRGEDYRLLLQDALQRNASEDPKISSSGLKINPYCSRAKVNKFPIRLTRGVPPIHISTTKQLWEWVDASQTARKDSACGVWVTTTDPRVAVVEGSDVSIFLVVSSVLGHLADSAEVLQAARLASSARAIALKAVDAAQRSQVDAQVAAGAALLSQQLGTSICALPQRAVALPSQLSQTGFNRSLSRDLHAPGPQGLTQARVGDGVQILSQIDEVREEEAVEDAVSFHSLSSEEHWLTGTLATVSRTRT